ncbi:putative uDP-N-acetylenolpyruvoylglucosamine reductase [Mycobacteroides abscessus]|nr:putative uDP-N-acetylenolpyruvoylglucosamine reductase [Mycobacteroides abscessus]
MRGVVLEVEFGLSTDGLSAAIRYPELAKELGVAQGDRTDASAVREAVLGLRRRKGMVLDESDRDTWSVGSFFTNPVVAEGDVDGVRARVHEHLGPGVVMPLYSAQHGVKLSAAGSWNGPDSTRAIRRAVGGAGVHENTLWH